MANTSAALATLALVKLMVPGTEQAPSAGEQAKAEAAIPSMFADLETRNVYSVGNTADIDNAAFDWLALILSEIIAPWAAGRQTDFNVRNGAELMLHTINATRPTYQVMTAEHF